MDTVEEGDERSRDESIRRCGRQSECTELPCEHRRGRQRRHLTLLRVRKEPISSLFHAVIGNFSLCATVWLVSAAASIPAPDLIGGDRPPQISTMTLIASRSFIAR